MVSPIISTGAAGGIWNVTSSDAVTDHSDVTNGACWTFDTDQTTDVFRGVATKGSTVGTFAAAVTGDAPPTDDPFVLRIEQDSTGAGFFSMSRVPSGYTAGDGVGPLEYRGAIVDTATATTAMAPFIAVTARAGTDNLAAECDYIFCAAARSIK